MGVTANSLKNADYKRAYLLYGSEAYLRRYYKNALKNALVREGDNLNFSSFEGKDTDVNDVVAQISTMPFLADHRVVIVENSGWFSAGKGDSEDGESSGSSSAAPLVEALKSVPDETVIIFSEEKVDKRSKLFKAVGNVGIVEEFPEQTADSLVRWLANIAAASGKSIDAGTAGYLVNEAGNDMFLLDGEMAKLIAYCNDRDRITTRDIDEVCTHQINAKIFDMIAATAAKRPKEVLKIYNDLLTLRESPFMVLSLLVRQYTQLLTVKDCMTRNESAAAIASKLGIQDWLARKLCDSARKMTMEELKGCLEKCARTDGDIKSGNVTDKLGVELLLAECATGTL